MRTIGMNTSQSWPRHAVQSEGDQTPTTSKMDPENRPKAAVVHNEITPKYVEDRNAILQGGKKGLERRKGVTLEWKAVSVFVPHDRGSVCKRICRSRDTDEPQIKQVLYEVNGKAEPGTLLAVMGASGAGKSTLMNVLAYRNIGSVQVTGTVTVNNKSLGLGVNSISAYVQQEDLFIGTLTVREHLTVHALLRMDKKFTKQQRLDRVEEIINELGLTKCADTLIGTPGRVRGISGGEKKRLSFASEILTDPAILFADEPTSGLDSFMAQSVVATLQKLANQGRTIICTIHQPSSEVYAMFDSILLMAEGRTAYIGRSEQAIPYFANFGYVCPSNFNPADYFVNTLAIVPGEEEECRQRITEICDHYAEREQTEDVKETASNRRDSFSDEVVINRSPYKTSWCQQFSAVLWRSWISNKREKFMFQIRLFQSIMIGLIAGLIYLQTPANTAGVQNISGAIFFLVIGVSFTSLQAVIFVFPAELPVFIREHKNGMYRTDVYFLCKTLAEIPVFIISPLLLAAIAYWMIGLNSDPLRFLVCFAVLVLLTNVAVSFGYIISSMVSTVEAASALGPSLMLPLLLFGGFFLKNTTVPVYFVWIKFISWFKYGFELLNINQWEGYGKIGDGCPLPFVNRTSPGNHTGGKTEFCIPDGDAALEFLDLDKDNFMVDIYALLGLFVAFRLLAFLLLLRRSSKKQ